VTEQVDQVSEGSGARVVHMIVAIPSPQHPAIAVSRAAYLTVTRSGRASRGPRHWTESPCYGSTGYNPYETGPLRDRFLVS
jgi:hypothetical protein